MSLIHIDSCGDAYTTDELPDRFLISGVSPIVEIEGGRNGSQGIKCSATTEYFERAIPSNTTLFAGIAVKIPSVTTTADIMLFGETAIDHVIIRVLATGAIQALRGATVLGTSAGTGLFLPGSFAYVEVKTIIHGSTGEVTIHIDGTEVLTLTSVNTQNGGTGVVTRVRYAGSTDTVTYDDLYILNDSGAAPQNTYLGDVRVDANLPDSDGATSDFPDLVPASPTDHYLKVNDSTPDGDVSYIASPDNADIDLFGFTPLVTIGGANIIYGVALNIYARKDNEGGRQVIGKARPVATNYNGSTGTLSGSYNYFTSLWDLNPETSLAWTDVLKDASEFGVEVG